MTIERSLVLIKPDGVKRAIVGKIISRFEDAGLKIVGMKMVWISESHAKEHYKLDEEWAKSVFDKTKKAYEKENKPMKYKSHMELGETIQRWNMNFLKEGPVIAMVIEGPHAIELVRKMIGSTEPRAAAPGTIRGDYASTESYAMADTKQRVLRNLIHASDAPHTASREISLWFKPEELHSYKTVHDLALDHLN